MSHASVSPHRRSRAWNACGSRRRSCRPPARLLALAIACTLVLTWAALGAREADASLGELSFLGCIGQVSLSECAAVPPGLKGAVEEPKGIAVSPDGANVYAADDDANTVDVFARNALTGALTLTSCIGQHAGCATTSQAKAVERPFDVAVSPDGENIYAVSVGSNTLSEFSRNTSTGELTYTGCIGQLSECTPTTPSDAIDGPATIAISADGTSVYVASENAGGAVDEFQRDTANGALKFEGCIGAGGCTAPSIPEALRLAYAVAISPDGNNVYVSGQGASVTTFTRSSSTGALTFKGCIGNSNVCEQTKPLAINEPTSLAISPNGANLYAGNFANGVVDVFTRNATTGALTFSGCNGALAGEPRGSCTELPSGNPAGPLAVAISPDGADLYVAGEQGVYEYARGTAGALKFAGCTGIEPGLCTATVPEEALFFSVSLALSPDGTSLYDGAELGKDLNVFGRQTQTAVGSPPPNTTPTQTSSGTSETAAFTAASVPLAGIANTPAAVEELLLGCSKRSLVLNDVFVRGSRVGLEGSAAKSLDGKKVKIVFDAGKVVASATVGRNGQFSTAAPLPPASLRDGNNARYEAESGSQRSLDLKLTRRLSLEPPKVSGDTVALIGQVAPPLTKPVAKITVQQELECGRTTVVAHVTPSASGRFRITVTVPAAAKAGVYRLISSVRENTHSTHGFATYSLPLPAAFG